MSYILDTHVLLWWLDDPKLLSAKANNILTNIMNIVYISCVSTWEIVIKQSLGKLKVPKEIFEVIEKENFFELPISIEHPECLSTLPDYHKDPFDRLLISQAVVEKAKIITNDKMIIKYPIPTVEA